MKNDDDKDTKDWVDDPEYMRVAMPADPIHFVTVLVHTMTTSLRERVDPIAIIECASAMTDAWLQNHDIENTRIH